MSAATPALRLSWTVEADLPALAGHFPGRPIVPGALLLAQALQAVLAVPRLAARIGAQPQLEAAKFLLPVGPGSRLELHVFEASAALRFELRQGATLVASGRWSAPVAVDGRGGSA